MLGDTTAGVTFIADLYDLTKVSGSNPANVVNFLDLQLLAHAWLVDLGQPNLTFADVAGYEGVFRDDVIAAFNIVPEPTSAGLLLLSGLLAFKRGRR